MRNIAFVACLFIVCPMTATSQCLSKDSLWNRLNFIHLANTDKLDKLKELLRCEEQVKDCPKNTDSVYTHLLLNIGVQYYMRANYTKAIQYTRQAINIARANIDDAATDKIHLVRYYYYLSIYYDSLHLASQRHEAVDSCISSERRFNTDYFYSALVLENNVRELFLRGDYKLCVDHSSLGEGLIHRFYKDADSLTHLSYFIYYKARSLGFLGRYDEEEKFLKSKIAMLRSLEDKEFRGGIYILFGQLYRSKGQYRDAAKSLQKALDYDMSSPRRELTPSILNQIGLIYSEDLGEYAVALGYYQNGLKHCKLKRVPGGGASDSFYLLGNMAKAYVKMKLFDSALYFFQLAFNTIKPGINERDLALHVQEYVNDNNVDDVLRLVLDKADSYLQRFYRDGDHKDLEIALKIYKTADQLLNSIRIQLGDIESKLFWRQFSKRLFQGAIEASFLTDNIQQAFYFFEKSRAVLLADQLGEQARITDSDLIKLSELKRRILTVKRKQNTIPSTSSEYANAQHDLLMSELDLSKMGLAIKNNNPLYYQSFFDTTFITLQEIQEYLGSDKTLIELYEGDSTLYNLTITATSSILQKIDRNVFDSLSEMYTSNISDPVGLNKNFDSFVNVSHRLCQLVFQKNELPTSRVIISSDGKYFPFEALVTQTKPLMYFVDDHAVSYTYSARYLLNTFNDSSSQDSQMFLGMAPVKFANLPELTGSDLSLKRVQSYFKQTTNYIGRAAAKNKFLNEFYKYRIIQLYTHATDSGYAAEPTIYFSDSTLNLSDLLPAQRPVTGLIVLSACETASGKLYGGEGVFSFNRGFAAVGIPSSISNLWQVDNKSTYRLTELFYKYVKKGLPLDIALQKAKVEFRKTTDLDEQKLPYYWAASILVGKTDAINLQTKSQWMWIVIATTLCALLFIAWWVWKNRFSKFNVR